MKLRLAILLIDLSVSVLLHFFEQNLEKMYKELH
jgi:hypothetical protein